MIRGRIYRPALIVFMLTMLWFVPKASAQNVGPAPVTIETQFTAVTSPTETRAELEAERQRLELYEQQLEARENLLDERAEVLDERAEQLDERAELLREREAALTTEVPIDEPLVVEPAGPSVEGFFEDDAERAEETGEAPDTFVPGLGEEFSPGVPEEDFQPGVQDTEQDFFN